MFKTMQTNKSDARTIQWKEAEILKAVSRLYPACPYKHAQRILKIISRQEWLGVRLSAVVERVAGNVVRHDLTDYDLLMDAHGLTQEEARIAVDEEVSGILGEWRQRS